MAVGYAGKEAVEIGYPFINKLISFINQSCTLGLRQSLKNFLVVVYLDACNGGTGIIKIPKLKLMSGLSMRLGAQANPVVGKFSAVGVPVESRHNSYVMEVEFLNNDIDSDM